MTDQGGDRLTQDQLRGIGQVTVNFNYLEGIIGLLIYIFSGLETQKMAQAFTSKLSFRYKLDLLEALVVERGPTPDQFRGINLLIRKADRYNSRRNELIHSTWMASDDPKKALRMKGKLKHGYKVVVEEMDVYELERFARLLDRLSEDFIKFQWKMYP